jgi:hypothetical protein
MAGLFLLSMQSKGKPSNQRLRLHHLAINDLTNDKCLLVQPAINILFMVLLSRVDVSCIK